MRKSVTLVLCLLLMASTILMPIPSEALKYGKDTDVGNIDASFWGEVDQDRSSDFLYRGGDINGDGLNDILIGARDNDEGPGSSAGQSYLIFGKSTGWVMDIDLSNADASFIGENNLDYAGMITSGGDINADGYEDILIGASGNDDADSNAGKTYIIFGEESNWSMDTSLSKADASYLGETSGDGSGYQVAGVGDVNGDGLDDILISAKNNDEGPGSGAGQIYLIFGKTSGWGSNVSLANADASFIGEGSGDSAGWLSSGRGDVNNDGYDDILIGASSNDEGGSNAGQIYLIFGKSSNWSMDTSLSNANASFLGEFAGDRSGQSISCSGDVNGDGFDDILISAHENDTTGSDVGKVYLIFGMSLGWSMDTSLSNADASFVGENVDDWAGYNAAILGDVNGDGYDDISIGASRSDDGALNAGQVYLVLGKNSGWVQNLNLDNADASFLGDTSNDFMSRTSMVGDVNGDGYDDLLTGSSWNEEGGTMAGQTYLIFPDSNSKPSSIDSVKVYSDDSYSTEISYAKINDTIFVELQGVDGNSSRKDIALANVTSSISSPKGFTLRLMETNVNSAKYRGNFNITNRTHERMELINASEGDLVTVSSVQNPLKKASLYIGNLLLFPLVDNGSAYEDILYNEHYWSVDWPDIDWVFNTNASWLDWNDTTHNVSGIPDNSEVGNYWVRINISVTPNINDEHYFILTVENSPPDIITNNSDEVIEDTYYWVDYNSTDDGQGTITWHLETDADDWLSINPVTGILNGTPWNEHVGNYFVNVSVDDGNGGWNHTNFTLTVENVNDPPLIIGDDITEVFEDSEYLSQYNATDIDEGDDVYGWSISTNATWLNIDGDSGLLYGTPVNEDIGFYFVNLTAKDGSNAPGYRDFEIEVINTNDLPNITSSPPLDATALFNYGYNVRATDVDVGDVLTYSLDIKPENMTIDGETGLIEWIPTVEQEGLNLVIVNVTDGNSSIRQAFNITVIVPTSFPPQTILLSPADGTEVFFTTPVLSWSWEDPDSDTVYFYVYLSKVEANIETLDESVKIADAISETSLSTSALEKGATYYWTVIPDDNMNVGKCKNGIWSFRVAVTAIENKAPIISSQPVKTAEVGKQYQYQVVASDDDPGDTLTFSLKERPDGMIIDADTGLILWTPTEAQEGNHTVTVQVSDEKVSVTQTYKIKVTKELPPVNNKPVIIEIPDRTIKVGEEFIYQVAASDLDVDILTYKLDGQPAGMDITSTGLISWTPSKDQVGEHTITVNVSDGKDHAIAHFKITVEKKGTTPGDGGLDATMLAIIAAIIIAVVVALLVVVATRGRKKEVEEVEEEEEPEEPLEEPPEPPKEAPVEEEAEPEEPEEKPEAELEDEIDLDDLEDED